MAPPPNIFAESVGHCDQECIFIQTCCAASIAILLVSLLNTRRLLHYNYGMCSTLTSVQWCLLAYVVSIQLLALFPHSVVIITSIQHVIRAVFVYRFTSLRVQFSE